MAGIKPHRRTWWETWETYICKFQAAIRSSAADAEFHRLLSDCLAAYSKHLNVSTTEEALAVMSGYGCSSLEIAFMWMGRWRPTSAVVLVYTTMGLAFDQGDLSEKITEQDISKVKPSILSEKQLSDLSALQKRAHQAESDLSEQLATLQMLLVDQDVVATLGLGDTNKDVGDVSNFQHIVDLKLKELQMLLNKADKLRLHTLQVLLELLTPLQATHCSIAAYKLMSALRSFSKAMETT